MNIGKTLTMLFDKQINFDKQLLEMSFPIYVFLVCIIRSHSSILLNAKDKRVVASTIFLGYLHPRLVDINLSFDNHS